MWPNQGFQKAELTAQKNDKRSKKTVTESCWGSKIKLNAVEDVLNAGNRSLL
jgi:hypothetical protein